MKRSNTLPSRSRRAFCLLCVGLALLVGQPAFTDDTDLLRTNTVQPYVLIILDNSNSMNLDLGSDGDWNPLTGDNPGFTDPDDDSDEEKNRPGSRIYEAKKALYEALKDVSGVNWGFMTFNQNELRVRSKHWLYGPVVPEVPGSDPGGWPLLYPIPDRDGNGLLDATDDVFTLGRHLDDPSDDDVPPARLNVAGSCDNPLDLSDPIDRAKANRFPKLGETGDQTTTLWVTEGDARYRLDISQTPPATGPLPALGSDTLDLDLTATRIEDCDFPDVFGLLTSKQTVTFGFLGEFLMADDNGPDADDSFEDNSNQKNEGAAGFWDWDDAQSLSVCSDKSPFSGKGIESNYDDPDLFASPPPDAMFANPDTDLSSEDQYCPETGDAADCRNLKLPTLVDGTFPELRELDRGDFIPYHWNFDAKDDLLRRFNPKHKTGSDPDFGIASYFADQVDSTGNLPLKNDNQKPIITTGPTPFGKAVNDYRCWYLGPNASPASKCREGGAKLAFEEGWQEIARDKDPDFACRRPYVILVSDGEDTCGGENVSADINDFDQEGVRTWILNVGGKKGENRFQSIVGNAQATLINVNKGEDLKNELIDIIGEIISDTRAFASAAVPSVQIEAGDKILLTSFNPIDGSPTWAGNALAFLKPLPTKEEPPGSDRFVPDLSEVCNDTTILSECFLWNAGEVLKTQVNIADPVGSAVTQRRVYYPQAPSGDGVPMTRGELEGSTASGAGSAPEKDLWQGLGIPFTDGLTPSEEAARIEAKRILDATYSIKIGRLDPNDATTEIEFLLGDTFHADPVALGGPTSNLLFSQDFKGYRDFATKHRFRRKMLATAANDGMLHLFDLGVAEIVAGKVKFTNGTGKEIAAFVPRTILPKLQPLADGSEHLWSVDGGLAIADVYFDPKHTGTPDPDNREWRTVLVAGLRRGGEAVYALDITQPDELKEVNLTGPPAQTVVVPTSPGTVPDCREPAGGTTSTPFGCHYGLGFASPLWEFDDTVEIAGTRYRLDEDGNGEFDLAFTWSKPNIGRIQVDDGGTIVDKFVAVFGGGLDPEKPTTRGDWLYIVDIETGKAIYKEQLRDPYDAALPGGAAPSEPAAVDTNQNGLLDTIYISTTGGYVYRVDLGPDANGDLPELADHTFDVDTPLGPKPVTVPRIRDLQSKPRVVFDNFNTATGKRLPFFFRPSVLFTPLLAPHFGLALGDGDRENLWTLGQSPGRFYVFVDDIDPNSVPDPLDIITADLLETAPVGLSTGDFLFTPQVGKRNGWVLELADNERVVSDAFSLSGITVFTTYTPDDNTGEPAPGGGGGNNNNTPPSCARTGKSQVFGVLTTNANGVLFDSNSDRTRSTSVDTLVGKAFADLSVTQNPITGGGTTTPPAPLPPNRQLIFDELKKLFPSNCRFANYRIDIRAIASDTEIIEVAPVPVCIIEKNWREF